VTATPYIDATEEAMLLALWSCGEEQHIGRAGVLLCPPGKDRIEEFAAVAFRQLFAQSKRGDRIRSNHRNGGLPQNSRAAFALG